jgi:hypothetical protein
MKKKRERPAVLGVRFGVNPNSSSLGVDVTYLLLGGAAALASGLFLTAWLRGKRKQATVYGPEAPEQPPR